MPRVYRKKKKTIKLISRPLLIFSSSTVLEEIKQHIRELDLRLIDLKNKLFEEKNKRNLFL